jgi:hypothetical protein
MSLKSLGLALLVFFLKSFKSWINIQNEVWENKKSGHSPTIILQHTDKSTE